MRNHILGSLIRSIITMLIVMTIVFVLLRSGPLDPARYILGDYATAETIKNLREQMKLDRPIYVQYLYFLERLMHGDLGRSFINKQPVLSQLTSVLPYTMELVIAGVILGILMGVPPGIVAALRPNSIFDHLIRLLTLVGISVPIFVSGIFLISIFSLKWDLLPIIGGGASGDLKNRILMLILPAFSCGIWMLASIARLTRASLLEVLKKDYIVTARSKGLRERIVILKHALRNSLLPLITSLGIYINILLGSAVLTEIVFTRPGIGRLIVESIISGDFQMVQILIMLYAGTVVMVNLLVDLTYSLVDPRIAYK
ncbi:MAG: ABC transporter permease [Deltaproteobacteria bacterium]|nr:ABC transporter permease [Deltaproteobacteria bacterium]